MGEVIKDVIEIDESARKKVLDAEAKKEQVHLTIQTKKTKIKQDLDAKVAAESKAYEDELIKKVEAQKAVNQTEIDEAVTQLQDRFDANADAWVQSILDNIKAE